MGSFNGIDVSRWQGNINWAQVAQSGVTSVILKCGGSDDGAYTDKTFEANYQGAKAAGLKVGVYYFVGKDFFTVDAGIANANHCLRILNGRPLDYPVYCDVEAPPSGRKFELTQATLAFCATIQNGGYKMGIYGSDISGFKDRMDYNTIILNPDISLWVARYGSQPKYATKWDIWQSSSSGSVPGISGRVDTDVFKFGETVNTTPAAVTIPEALQVVDNNITKELAQKIYALIKDYL